MKETVEKALERLVTALISDLDARGSRVDLIEEALSYAALALGMSPPDYKALREQLDTVAVQLIGDKIQEDDLKVYQIVVSDEDDNHLMSVFATGDAKTVNQIVNLLEKNNKDQKGKKEKKKDSDYSVN